MTGYGQPALAAQLHLPSKTTLDYVQALSFALLALIVVGYLLSRAARDPKALVKAGKRKARKVTGI